MTNLEFGMLDFRLGLGDKLSLACTEKKGRAQATIVGGTSVMLPTGMLAAFSPSYHTSQVNEMVGLNYGTSHQSCYRSDAGIV